MPLQTPSDGSTVLKPYNGRYFNPTLGEKTVLSNILHAHIHVLLCLPYQDMYMYTLCT